MASPIDSIINKSTRNNKEKFNCISFPTHERFQSNLAGVACNFWLLQGTPGVKGNGWIQSYAQMPNNHQLLPPMDNPLQAIPPWISVDFTLGQHRFGQAQTALELANILSVKSVILEHTTVTNDSLRKAAPELKKQRGDVNVFISKSSALAWEWSLDDPSVEIIEHGVDSQGLFKPYPQVKKEPYVLCIVNDWVNRGDILGWDIFQRVIANNKIPCRVLGDNPGISAPAKNVFDLVQEYNKATLFYNTSRHSPIPCVLLEAMSCGLPVVTTDNYLISDIIVNGVNGLKTNGEAEQLNHIRRLMNDPEERSFLGRNARQTIVDRFSMERFTSDWNRVFERVSKL